MNILIEGEKYDLTYLNQIFSSKTFFDMEGRINGVGYYHSFEKNSLVFMLPKVFIKSNSETVFNLSIDQLASLLLNKSSKHQGQYKWIRDLSIYFYQSLIQFKKRNPNSTLIYNSDTFDLRHNKKTKAYSYLDLVNSFMSFYKYNKNFIISKKVEFNSNVSRNTNWGKTIRKSTPIHVKSSTPVYIQLLNKKKKIDYEEELITYFLSILYHLQQEYFYNIKIDKGFKLIKGNEFEALCKKGTSKLRKIKLNYFSDIHKQIYNLCEIFFSTFDKSSIKRKKEDFISIRNYNIVFEDMIDKLLSDSTENYKINNRTIQSLKTNDDGKIVDHLYSDQSLLDNSKIFYIGDSKYYKSNNQAGRLSIYKQFTYAKNIIQFNINRLNTTGQIEPFIYREQITNGYNISPNFFIYGYVNDKNNYDIPGLIKLKRTLKSYHFKERLFDRDTLFLHQYKINYLFVLKSYTEFNFVKNENFKSEVKHQIRLNFINYFNNVNQCGFSFYLANINPNDYKKFVQDNFYILNGKCYITKDNKLILAVNNKDKTLETLLCHFIKVSFKELIT